MFYWNRKATHSKTNQMNRNGLPMKPLAVLAMVATMGAAAPARAADLYYNDFVALSNGEYSYDQLANWSFDAPTPTVSFVVPGANDSAIFDLGVTQSSGVVMNFGNSSYTNDELVIREMRVDMRLSGVTLNYTRIWVGEDSPFSSSNSESSLFLVGGQLNTTSDVFVGSGSNLAGKVSMRSGTDINIGNSLALGFFSGSTGRFEVTDGSNTAVANDTLVGVGGRGELIVTGNGSEFSSDAMMIGGTESNRPGTGSVSVGSGATIEIHDFLKVWEGGVFDHNGGSTTVGTNLEVTGGTFNYNGGNTAIENDLVVSSGTLNVNSGRLWAGGPSAPLLRSGVNVGGSTLVTGSESVVNANADGIVVGRFSTGQMTVSNGATVNASRAISGFSDSSNGTLDVDNATLDISGDTELGWSNTAQGTINLTNGALMQTDALYVGGSAVGNRGTGTVNVSGSSDLDVTNLLQIYDSGTLNVNDGTSLVSASQIVVDNGASIVNAGHTVIGTDLSLIDASVSADTSATVRGSWTTAGDFAVATRTGETASLLIESTGDFTSNGIGYLAFQPGTNGTVTVDGGTWTHNDRLRVGFIGTGTLNIMNGGDVTTDSMQIGRGDSGVVAISGAASTLTTGSISVLGDGLFSQLDGTTDVTGALAIDGGQVNGVGGLLQAGSFAINPDGTLTQDGGTIDVAGNIDLASSSTATINAGTLNAGAMTFDGGALNHNGGTVDVTGAITINSGGLIGGTTGQIRSGSLAVEPSGVLRVGDINVGGPVAGNVYTGSLDVFIGGVEAGTLTVNNSGTVDIESTFGYFNATDVFVNAGGMLTSGRAVEIGHSNPGFLDRFYIGSELAVDGPGAILDINTSLRIGRAADGLFNVTGGGTAEVDFLFIANAAGRTGTVNVSGSDSLLGVTNRIQVGDSGTGFLNINSGGTVTAPDIYIGGTNVNDTAGVGTLSVSDSSSIVNIAGDLKIWDGGTLNFNGGSITTMNFDSADGTFNFTDGTLTIDGGAFTDGLNALFIDGAAPGDNPTLILNGSTLSRTSGNIGPTNGGTFVVQNAGSATFTEPVTVGTAGDLTVSDSSFTSTLLNVNGGALDVQTSNIAVDETIVVAGGMASSNVNVLVGEATPLPGNNFNNTTKVTIDGPGSQFDVNAILSVGRGVDGTVDILNGGRLNVSDVLRLGDVAGTTGTVNVNGSTLDAQSATHLGHDAGSNAVLNVLNGGTYTANGIYVGGRSNQNVDATGTLHVTGGIVDNSGELKVWPGGTLTHTGGRIDADSLSVVDGTVNTSSEWLAIGSSFNSNGPNRFNVGGSATVTGSSATLTADGLGIILGQDGVSYSLDVADGATVVTDNLWVNTDTNETATLNIDNATVTTTLPTWVGSNVSGTGIINVTNSGVFDTTALYLGGQTGENRGAGELNVTSSLADIDGLLRVWDQGTVNYNSGAIKTDNLIIEQGGVFNFNGASNMLIGSLDVGGRVEVFDSVIVRGAGAQLNIPARVLAVGNDGGGTHTMDVLDSGLVHADALQVGLRANTTGILNVNDATVTVDNGISVGRQALATGTINVSNSGVLTTNQLGLGGSSTVSGGTGALNVSDTGSLVDVADILRIWGQGTLNFDGGQINAGSVAIEQGAQLDATGTIVRLGIEQDRNNELDVIGNATVDGQLLAEILIIGEVNGAQMDVGATGDVRVTDLTLRDLTSTLNINGGSVAVTRDTQMGFDPNSTTTIDINSGGSLSTDNLSVGGRVATGNVAGASGLLDITGGSTVTVGNVLSVLEQGTVNLTDGTVTADRFDYTGGGAFNFTGGTLAVNTFDGNLVNLGGTVSPGSSPGTTSVMGDYSQDALSTLLIEIDGLIPGTEFDQLLVTGTAALDGTLDLDLLTYTPNLGDTFDIIQADTITGGFATLDLPLLSGDLFLRTDTIVNPTGTDVFRLTVVPEPSSMLLLGLGAVGCLVGARLRRRRRPTQ